MLSQHEWEEENSPPHLPGHKEDCITLTLPDVSGAELSLLLLPAYNCSLSFL